MKIFTLKSNGALNNAKSEEDEEKLEETVASTRFARCTPVMSACPIVCIRGVVSCGQCLSDFELYGRTLLYDVVLRAKRQNISLFFSLLSLFSFIGSMPQHSRTLPSRRRRRSRRSSRRRRRTRRRFWKRRIKKKFDESRTRRLFLLDRPFLTTTESSASAIVILSA